MARQLTEQEKKDDLDDKLLYETVEAEGCPMTLTQNGCGVCDRIGFPLFLVRKAVIKKNYKDINWSQNILKLKDRELDTLSTHEYVYRTLRTGYVYILAKQDDKYEYLGYEVTPSGVFRHKTINNMVERNIRDIPKTCTKKNDHIKGAFITIDPSVHKGTAYIAYTRRAWSDSALQHYREAANASDTKALQRFSTIILPEGIGTENPSSLSPPTDVRTFAFTDFKSTAKLLELELGPNDLTYIDSEEEASHIKPTGPLDKDNNATKAKNHFITVHQFNSFKVNRYNENKSCVKELYDHVANLEKDRQNTKVGVLVLEDTFGVAEELSYQRQLLVEPIITTIAKAEEQYANDLDYVYRKELSSQDSKEKYEDLLEKAIKEYQERHPEEAAHLYDPKIKEGRTYTDISQGDFSWVRVNESERYFLDNKYLNDYSPLYLGELNIYTEYFNEKNFHLRKVLAYIESYKNYLKSACDAKFDSKIIHIFDQEFSDSDDYDTYRYNIINKYSEKTDLYEKVEITTQQKEQILTEKNKSAHQSIAYTDVAIFKQKETESYYKNRAWQSEKLFKEEWERVYNRLNLKRFDDFKRDNATLFQQIVDDVTKNSKDYFYYASWLFGKDDKPSTLLPELKQYNNVHFWLKECETNCSSNHIGYLADFLKMIDFTVVGNIPIQEQNGFWETLLSNNNTLYYYLFHGNSDNNFWDVLIQARLLQDDFKSGLSEQEKTLAQALQYIETNEVARINNDKILSNRFYYEKGMKIVQLYSLMVTRSSAAVAQFSDKKGSILDIQTFRSHLCQSMMVFNKRYAICSQVDVKIEDIKSYINKMMSKPTLFLAKADKDTLAYLQQYNESNPVGQGETSSTDGKRIAFEFSSNFSSLKDLNDMYKAIKDKNGLTSLPDFINSFKSPSVKGNYGVEFGSKPVLKFDMQVKTMTLKTSVGDIFSNTLNGISLALEIMDYLDNVEKLEEANTSGQIGQHQKDKLINEINQAHAKIIGGIVVAIDSAMKLFKISMRLLFESQKYAIIAQKMTTHIMLGAAPAVFIANQVLGVLSIMEGVNNFNKGTKLKEAGDEDLGLAFQVCSAIQIFVGIVMLLKGLGVLGMIPVIGGILYIIALVLGIIVTVILWFLSDETENWTPMQWWFNRCLFGNWKQKVLHKPYPANFLGMGVAGNDFVVAMMGVHTNIEYMKGEHAYFASFPMYQQEIEKNRQMSKEDLMKSLGIDSSLKDKITREALIAVANGVTLNTTTGKTKGLYLQMTLPNFDLKTSHFEAEVRISKGKETLVLSVKFDRGFGTEYPNIEKVSGSLPSFVQRTVILSSDSEERKKQISVEHLKKQQEYGFEMQPKIDPNTLLPILDQEGEAVLVPTNRFKITYKLGELYGKHDIYLKVKYWQTNVIPEEELNAGPALPILPLISTYSYAG